MPLRPSAPPPLDILYVIRYHVLVTNRLKRRTRSGPGVEAADATPPVGALPAPGLRERKKQQTRKAIQKQALRLFAKKGYEATTVDEIAAAAGVSHMTFFRYFPTKEDVVLSDDYDPLIATLIAARPPAEPVIESIRLAIRASFAQVFAADRETVLARTRLILRTPALRTRLWEHGGDTEQLITHTIAGRFGCAAGDLRVRVVAAACLSAITVAILQWADNDGKQDLAEMVDQALKLLRKDLC